MTDYPDLCGDEPSCQKPELLKRIRELEAELKFVVKAWVKPQDELTPDEIIYMMSAREALADE